MTGYQCYRSQRCYAGEDWNRDCPLAGLQNGRLEGTEFPVRETSMTSTATPKAQKKNDTECT